MNQRQTVISRWSCHVLLWTGEKLRPCQQRSAEVRSARPQSHRDGPSARCIPCTLHNPDRSPPVPRIGVVVAGGGPAGYATAIALARRGFRDIVVLERAPTASWFDETRSIVFGLTPPAKAVLRELGLDDIDHAGACLFCFSSVVAAADARFKLSVAH